MITVNLANKRSKAGENKFVTIFFVFFWVFAGLFLISLGYVLVMTYLLNFQMKSIETERQYVSADILKNSEALNNFVYSKVIIEKIVSMRASRFDYIGYLDDIKSLLPDRVELGAVDFSVKGWVFTDVILQDEIALKVFENRLLDRKNFEDKPFLGGMILSVSRDTSGLTRMKLLFQLSK